MTNYEPTPAAFAQNDDLFAYERAAYASGKKVIAGVDEVGRGPLAGPVVVCAVILPEDVSILGLDDSKKLSEKKREILYTQIVEQALAICIIEKDAQAVDASNIYRITQTAMYEAIQQLSITPDYVLIDAMPLPELVLDHTSIIKGDGKSQSIAAASIVAKVTRDRMMVAYSHTYPVYGFEKHKGYGTKQHLEALAQHGACPLHRQSFAPVANLTPKATAQLSLFAQE
ncbi:MAG: ribonuclease HII [Culicoidibacterales bacterium]